MAWDKPNSGDLDREKDLTQKNTDKKGGKGDGDTGPDWKPDPALVDQLDAESPVQLYQVRPPKGYTKSERTLNATQLVMWTGKGGPDHTARFWGDGCPFDAPGGRQIRGRVGGNHEGAIVKYYPEPNGTAGSAIPSRTLFSSPRTAARLTAIVYQNPSRRHHNGQKDQGLSLDSKGRQLRN
jgi:hypothetical protein